MNVYTVHVGVFKMLCGFIPRTLHSYCINISPFNYNTLFYNEANIKLLNSLTKILDSVPACAIKLYEIPGGNNLKIYNAYM